MQGHLSIIKFQNIMYRMQVTTSGHYERKEGVLDYSTQLIPAQGERHYLSILLHHIPGATNYNNLKTLADGVTHVTFKEAEITLGLLKSDDEWDECLSESAV